jgi:hypothetical protein
VSGALTVGTTLTVNPGSWSRLPTAYAYQWERCLLACQLVRGATGTSYTLAGSDYGATFEVSVTASNAAGATAATSAITAAVGLPGQTTSAQPSGTTPSSSTPPAPAPTHTTRARAQPLRLSHVGLVGRRGTTRGQALVFTLSARAQVQVTLRAGHHVLGLTLSARGGQNRYRLTSLLRGRHLPPGRYAITVRAGNRTATLKLTA